MRSLGESLPAPDNVERTPDSAALTPERWLRVKSIFLEVVERPLAERGAVLDEVCAGDVAVRREVESLLANEAEASGLLELPAHALLGGAETSWRPRLEPGARLGPYEITGFIAAGGMGEVYRARHTLLDRVVAIKTVGGDLSDPTARRRLVREAQHTARLTHDNICTVYEVGEEGDQPYIVMEHLDGQSLRELLRSGPCDLATVLRIGIRVADALTHAHEHGIVHRDLKSSNVVIEASGRAVVLDFGLAKRLAMSGERPAESTLTMDGVLAGTLSHMSPEVLLGGEADARSDVWALGVLLYEMATGELPFTGRTSFETSAAIIGDPPRPIGGKVPLAVGLVIERCLAKNPGARYQRASAVRAAFDAIERRRSWPVVGRLLISARQRTVLATAAALALIPVAVWGAGGGRLRGLVARVTAAPVPTVAFLPLATANADSSAPYFADGMTDALIAELGAAANVRVISRASAKRMATDARTLADIARRLGATLVVEGTLRRTPKRVGIDMRLVDPERRRVLWSDRYDRDAADVLALQADVVRALSLAIRLTMRPGAETRLATVRAVRPDVYEEFLKGRFEWNQRTPQSLRRAIGHFSRAIELDATYAPAHAALADCYNQLGTVMVGSGSPQQFRPLAEAEAIKALQIDPSSAEAHAALGYAKHYQLRWADAEREFRRAIELNPSYALVHVWYANLLMSRRRFDKALREVGAARDLDPFSLIVNTNIGWILDVAGKHEQAIDQLRATLALDSEYVQARMRLVGSLDGAGRFEEAVAEARRVAAETGRSPVAVSGLAIALAKAGHHDEATAMLSELLAMARTQYVPAWSIGALYTALGNADSAVVWVGRAFDEGSNVIAYLAVEPLARPLQGDPRFQQLLIRAGHQ